MAHERLGKLCLLLTPRSLYRWRQQLGEKFIGDLALRNHGINASRKDFMAAYAKAQLRQVQLRKGYLPSTTTVKDKFNTTVERDSDILRYLGVDNESLIKDMAWEMAQAGRDPSNYELYEDVPRFFEMIESEEWPWTETILMCQLNSEVPVADALEATILQHLGVMVRDTASPDVSMNKQSVIGLRKATASRTSPFTSAIKMLQFSRPDHEDIQILSIYCDPQRELANTALFDFPGVLLSRPDPQGFERGKHQSPDDVYFRDVALNVKINLGYYTVCKKITQSYGVLGGFKNVAFIASLMALKNWRPEHSSRLKPLVDKSSNSEKKNAAAWRRRRDGLDERLRKIQRGQKKGGS